jgi:hypothetical protein
LTFAPTVEITRVYEKNSKNGHRYLVGRLGKARVLLFPADPTADSTQTWSMFLQADPSPAAQKKPNTTAGRAPRQKALFGTSKPASRAAAPALPDDRVDDLWTERTEP